MESVVERRLCWRCFHGSPAFNCLDCREGLTYDEWRLVKASSRLVEAKRGWRWQDLVLASGQWIFILALFPSLVTAEKPHVVTCLITAPTLIAFAVVFATLYLRWASFAALLSGMIWLTLFLQQVM